MTGTVNLIPINTDLVCLYREVLHLLEQDQDTYHWSLCKEFINWLDENDIKITEKQFKIQSGHKEYGLLFENEIDFIAFKLRWL